MSYYSSETRPMRHFARNYKEGESIDVKENKESLESKVKVRIQEVLGKDILKEARIQITFSGQTREAYLNQQNPLEIEEDIVLKAVPSKRNRGKTIRIECAIPNEYYVEFSR